MKIPKKVLVNRANVEPYLGAGSTGPKFGTMRKGVRCRLDSTERSTVQGAAGIQIVSKATAYFRPEDKLTNQSKVTIDNTRYEVLDVEPITGPFRVAGYKVALG